MRLRSLLLSVLMLVAALFTVNAKATNYSYKYEDVISEAQQPYTVRLTNKEKLNDFCMGYVEKFDLEGYLTTKIGSKNYIKVPVSKFEDKFDLDLFERLFTKQDFEVISKKILAEGYETTDILTRKYTLNENYIYIPYDFPLGNTLKVSVKEKLYPSNKSSKSQIYFYVFNNPSESAKNFLTIATGNKNINLNSFTFLRATYNLEQSNCIIIAY